MRLYLKVINPIVALVVLLLCLWAAVFDEGKFEPDGIIAGSLPTYFVAKGLFCSSALFILGKILAGIRAGRAQTSNSDVIDRRSEEIEAT